MRKVLLVAAAAGLAVSLFHPAAAQAAPDPSPAKARAEALRAQLDAATRAYVEAREALGVVEAQLRHAQQEMDAAAGQAAAARELLTRHAVSVYRSGGGLSPLSTLLTQDADQAIERIELVTVMAARQQRQIEDARAVTAAYDQAVKRFTTARDQRQALAAEQQAAVAALNERFQAAEALYQQQEAEARRAAQARLIAARAPLDDPSQDDPSQDDPSQDDPSQDDPSQTAGGGDGGSAAVSAGLACPIEGPYSYIDSWGAARSGGRGHKGTDVMAAHGKTVYAYADGEIFRTSVNRGLGGTSVWLRDAEGTEYYYAHLDSFSVKEGERVKVGEPIGVNGSTGNASADAPHVHFEVHPGGGEAVNPYPYVNRACG